MFKIIQRTIMSTSIGEAVAVAVSSLLENEDGVDVLLDINDMLNQAIQQRLQGA